jgi:hypothetical protein
MESEEEKNKEDNSEKSEVKKKEGEKKENKYFMKKKQDFAKELKKNPWIISSLVLGILTLILLISIFSGSVNGKIISKADAGEMLLNFYESRGADGLTLDSVETEGNFYKVDLIYEGQNIPFYMTKTGYMMGNELVSVITEEISLDPPLQNIPKSDKPVIELFIWSYCPYGVLAQGPMAEVVAILGDAANFKAVMYYDGHGPYETQQNKIQACIQEKDNDKYWDYAAGFVEDIYPICSQSRDVECDAAESIKLMKSLGINSEEIMSCVESEGADLIAADSAYARSVGVSGSPTVLVNGVKANVARSAEAYKGAVCEAFTEAPQECGEILSSNTTTVSGSC